ncbi:MAG: 2-dehydropantoate 2-reductase [Burkholderiaceae bacterium]|nr:2-dehydropantoate 2-reductase [Burkholderiaceae bacterium]
MRICVVGAGAIGGFLAGRLACAGHEVSVVARGAHLDAMRRNGLVLIDQHGESMPALRVRAESAERSAELGTQDLVVLALKSHQIADVAPRLGALCDARTPVVALQNGIPWWYFHAHRGPLAGRRLESVDPGGRIAACIAPQRVIGSVAHKGAELAAAGVVRHIVTPADRFPLGEPDGSRSERVTAISRVFQDAGVAAPVTVDIRTEKWFKLWGNVVWNPVCALTQATVLDLYHLPVARELGVTLMLEMRELARRLGVEIPGTPQQRLARALEIGAARPSMLQDVQAGRPIEIEALLGALVELADLTSTPVPSIRAVYACARLLDAVLRERKARIDVCTEAATEAPA